MLRSFTVTTALAGLALASTVVPMESASAQTRVGPAQTLVCASGGSNRENYCRADTRNGVALVRSTGRERCVIGRNWGYDSNGVWTADGCTGEFAIGRSGNGYGWGTGNRFTGYVYCAAGGNRRNLCEINTRGGVRLINQVSRAACVEGRTWGTAPRGIWVSGGCRGEFQVNLGGPNVPPPRPLPAVVDVTCESLGGRETFCRLPLDADRVVLDRQLSRAACIEGRTWGYRRDGIYVNNGCRAQFRVVDYRGRGSDRNRVRFDGRDEDIERVTCLSSDGRRNYCRFPNRGVRLVEQLGRAPCVEDRTWGHDRQGVWVDKGCRAVFDYRDREGRNFDVDRDGERDRAEYRDSDYDDR